MPVLLIRAGVSRRAWILALVFSFMLAPLANLMSVGVAVADEHMATMSHDAAGAHAMDHDVPAPCDHDRNCNCHKGFAAAHCCSQSAPGAAIWSSPWSLPKLESARCVDVDDRYAERASVDPPTPPPRTAQV